MYMRMWFVGVFLLFHVVSIQAIVALFNIQAQPGFGHSYLGNSRLCHQWNCINTKLNLTDALPPKDKYWNILSNFLAPEWQEIGQNAVNACYGERTKKYTNTCPGQALMHCVVDQMIDNCPAGRWNQEDGCASVSSLAAYNYMFSQSRYNNLENNLPNERRPSWFLQKYFNTKCCDLPPLFGEDMVKECGFKKFMEYHIHTAQTDRPFRYSLLNLAPTTTESVTEDSSEEMDPLECCNLSGFIEDSWRSECHFEMSWDVHKRLGFIDVSSHEPSTTTTERVPKVNDVKVVPLSCEKETCIFKKLNVINESGILDTVAFTKLLDNMTNTYPEWTKPKARVMTQCLNKLHRMYDAECSLNEVLQCVFDVLSENCPQARKDDPCKQKNSDTKDICQISGGKYTPKYRRQFCGIPNLVPPHILTECGVTSLSTLQYVPQYDKIKPYRWENKVHCKELTPPTSCLLNKMGVLSKYGFVDYFSMKNLIHSYSTSPLYELYFSVFLTTPMYKEYCSSPKKLLNLIDFMLMTCPATKRKENIPKCRKMFHELNTSVPQEMTRDQLTQIFRSIHNSISTKPSPTVQKNKAYFKTNKLFDFGIFGAKDAPPVNIIDVKPKPKTLVVLPVYQRMPNKTTGFPINSLQKDGIYRS
ncbi:uncharacterized protein LOC123696692 isoform X1 [Colias croceus]|uniref:uncharacterized protein LOC123696692 isoform X1 n=1 Tax=Colias crocea TaxID=72248 RepID=UPI001E27C986|nr:uncharacterized protein LOC123696692 isoform X1 [Colias croceus]